MGLSWSPEGLVVPHSPSRKLKNRVKDSTRVTVSRDSREMYKVLHPPPDSYAPAAPLSIPRPQFYVTCCCSTSCPRGTTISRRSSSTQRT
jgi:hypothetical protein